MKDSPLAKQAERAIFETNKDLDLSFYSPLMIWKGLTTFRKTLRHFRPDLVNPHCPPGHTFSALAVASNRHSIPLIRTIADPRSPNRNLINQFLHRSRTQGFIFTTESSRERYQQHLPLKTVRTKTILPGFRADDFIQGVCAAGIRNQLHLKDDILLLGIIARMSPEKGQEVFLKALSLLPLELRKRLHCILAGEDSRERGQKDLQGLARQWNVDQHLTFFNRLDDVRPLMSELDIGLITSTRSEAICRVALEYMSFGIPVISSDVNILPEIIQNESNGWVFRNQDARALAKCLQDALHNPQIRKQKGEAGFSLVRHDLSLSTELDLTIDFFKQAITHWKSA